MSSSKTASRKRPAAGAAKPVPAPAAKPEGEAPEPESSGERFIVLLRHGIAEDQVPGKRDEERALTPEGHARMKQIARGIESILPKVQAIYSSPLLRTVQTSLWVAKAYRSRVNVTTKDALAPDAKTRDFLAFVNAIEERRAIVVGHEPTLSAWLQVLTGSTVPMELKKGGCYGVRLFPDGRAVLEWLLPPRILRKLGE